MQAAGNRPATDFLQQWRWKNAYHSFEHALVGYSTAQSLHGEPVTVHYGFGAAPDAVTLRPYLFPGQWVRSENEAVEGVVTTVVFDAVR